ncbi:hypothetical protein TDB9533_01051 [Thalassocella blandensis]|nr:hypothetical protein TDB9533_01051 [Thalassocella blandensis]
MLYFTRSNRDRRTQGEPAENSVTTVHGWHERKSKRYLHRGNKKRVYNVFVPKLYKPGKAVPLIMVLHGCRQTQHDICSITGFNYLAEKHGFIVVYPFVTHYNDMRTRNCWGWWRPEHIKTGSGEVEDLRCIIQEVTHEFTINAKRIHITGLSSGAGMTVAALTVHPGLFASGAAVAGLAYGESASAVNTAFTSGDTFRSINTTVTLMQKARHNDQTPVPLCIVHSHDDETVSIQAGKNLRDSWLQYFGYKTGQVKCKRRGRSLGTPWEHKKYGRWWRKSIVETVFLHGPGHGWYGGNEGDYSYPAGPDVSKIIWKFFKNHHR